MKITFSKSTLSSMKSAYKRIFGLTDKDLADPEHKKIMESALESVWKYSGNFEGEPDTLADKRRALTSPSKGNVVDLAAHFKNMYPGKYSKLSNWDIIYTIFARMNSSEQDETDEPVMNEVEETTAEQSQLAENDSDTKNTEITVQNEKEIENMKNIENERATEQPRINIDALRNAGAPAGANVKSTVNMQQAARDEVNDTRTSRQANSDGSTVTRIILSSRPQKDRLENGEATKGHIAKDSIKKVRDKFVENTGYNETDGSFSKLVAGQEENAHAMLDALAAAEADPDYEFDINPSKSVGSVKGLEIKKPDGTVELQKKEETINYLLNQTAGYIKAVTAGALARVKVASAFRTSKKKKASEKLVNISEVQSVGEIAILQLDNKKLLLEDESAHAYWQNILPEIEEQSGCKSALSVKCVKKGKDGKDTTYTYRLPLVARMHKQDVTDADLDAKFGKPNRVGRAFDITNKEDMAKHEADFISMIALLAESGIANNDLAKAVRSTASANETADNEKVAADFQ